MQLHQLSPKHNRSSRKRVGRGGNKGTYSGRGVKGQKSRSGRKPRPGFAGGDTTLAQRLPKQRGQTGKIDIKKGVKLARLRVKPITFNLKEIEKHFKTGEIVSPASLLNKGLIDKMKGRIPKVKILSQGGIKKDLKFRKVSLSKSTKTIVDKASGPTKSKPKPKTKTKKTK